MNTSLNLPAFNLKKLTISTLLASISVFGTMSIAHADISHSQWNTLLNKHVKPINGGKATQVNYAGFKNDKAKLQAYLDKLSKVSKSDFNSWTKDQQLAFLINTYNAHTIDLVLTKYPVKSIKNVTFGSPWKKKFIPLFGSTYSLDNIEHDMIRSSKYADPRIHFAVNCASIGCPALQPYAYTGSRLNSQLEQATKKFLSDSTRNYAKGNTLYVSSIFKWYGGDFKKGWKGHSSLNGFFGKYSSQLGLNSTQKTALTNGTMKISYLPYDWNLNRTR